MPIDPKEREGDRVKPEQQLPKHPAHNPCMSELSRARFGPYQARCARLQASLRDAVPPTERCSGATEATAVDSRRWLTRLARHAHHTTPHQLPTPASDRPRLGVAQML